MVAKIEQRATDLWFVSIEDVTKGWTATDSPADLFRYLSPGD